MATLCAFALATSMRQDEICSIAIEDVDPDNRTVVIRDRKDPRKKDGNHQTVPLLPAAWAILEPILEVRKTGPIFPYGRAGAAAIRLSAVAQPLTFNKVG